MPNVSITGELSGFKLPESVREGYRAHYADLDIFGTVNFNRFVGAQVGWRSLDVGYLVDDGLRELRRAGDVLRDRRAILNEVSANRTQPR